MKILKARAVVVREQVVAPAVASEEVAVRLLQVAVLAAEEAGVQRPVVVPVVPLAPALSECFDRLSLRVRLRDHNCPFCRQVRDHPDRLRYVPAIAHARHHPL